MFLVRVWREAARCKKNCGNISFRDREDGIGAWSADMR